MQGYTCVDRKAKGELTVPMYARGDDLGKKQALIHI